MATVSDQVSSKEGGFSSPKQVQVFIHIHLIFIYIDFFTYTSSFAQT